MADPAAYRCPDCGCDDTQRLSLAYDQGTSRTGLFGVSVSTDGSLGVGGGSIARQSDLIKKLAPPKLERDSKTRAIQVLLVVAGAFATLLFVCAGGELILVGLAALTLFGMAIFVTVKGEPRRVELHKEWQRQVAIWDRTFFCKRCGQNFIPSVPGELSNDVPRAGTG